MKPRAYDIYCGLGGWTNGLLSVGYDVVGFDIDPRFIGRYPGKLIVQDALTIHGSQLKDAALLTCSPPCQRYSYMSQPWTLAKEMRAMYLSDCEKRVELNALFDACFRLQREAIEAAGRYIPLVVENVKGAQPWVGRAKAHYGSFYLWGDVGCTEFGAVVAGCPIRFGSVLRPPRRLRKVNHHLDGNVPKGTGKTSWFFGNTKHELRDGVKDENGFYVGDVDERPKSPGAGSISGYTVDLHASSNLAVSQSAGKNNGGGTWFSESHGKKYSGQPGNPVNSGVKQGGQWWQDPASMTRRFSSKSNARKEASAKIAMIPFELAYFIGTCYLPERLKCL